MLVGPASWAEGARLGSAGEEDVEAGHILVGLVVGQRHALVGLVVEQGHVLAGLVVERGHARARQVGQGFHLHCCRHCEPCHFPLPS